MFKIRLSERVASRLVTVVSTCVPKDSDAVVVHSMPDFEDGALSLLDELMRRGYAPTVVLEKPLDETSRSRKPRNVSAIPKNSARGRLAYLRASTIFTTHTPYRPHEPAIGQTVVNVWHGEALVKPVAQGDGDGPIPCTWATSLSSIGAAFRAAEFGLHPSRVRVLGAPRNDRMLAADRTVIRSRVRGIDDGTMVAAWLPTYRAREPWRRSGRVDGQTFAGPLPMREHDIAQIDAWLAGKNVLLLAKPHPTALSQHHAYKNITMIDDSWLANRRLTTYQLLAGVDVLLTDASSVWVDFLLLDRPIVFAFPDLKDYQASRGINLQPYEDWIPGPLVVNATGLINALEELLSGNDVHAEARLMTRTRFHKYMDDKSTVRLLDSLGM